MSQVVLNLGSIADIRQGYQFRTKITPDPIGSIGVIQMTSISEGTCIQWEALTRVANVDPSNNLRQGDVLFCARGLNNYAICIRENPVNIIAVSHFLVISPHSNRLNPEYLEWYFGQPEAVAYLRSNTLKSTVPLINKKTLEDMEIPLPDISLQKKIGAISRLLVRERGLMHDIRKKRELLVHAQLRQKIR